MSSHEVELESPTRDGIGIVLPIAILVVLLAGIIAGAFALGDDDDVDPVTLIGSAPDAAREAGSARMTMVMEMGGAVPFGGFEGSGVVDFESGAGTLEMSVLGSQIQVVTDGETLWMKMPMLLGGDKPWIEMPASLLQGGGAQLSGIDSATGMLETLRGVGAEEIEDLGTEDVNGYEATHYATRVNLADAIAAAPEATRGNAEAALEQFQSLGATDVKVDVWLTDSGLPVRQVMSFASEAAGAMPAFDMMLTIEMSDFGTRVEIEPPPADQVRRIVDPADLAEIFGGGFVEDREAA